jgi:hypothetical protein
MILHLPLDPLATAPFCLHRQSAKTRNEHGSGTQIATDAHDNLIICQRAEQRSMALMKIHQAK